MICDLDEWLAAVPQTRHELVEAAAFATADEVTPDADLDPIGAIPPLGPDRRRRSLPSGRDNDYGYRGAA